MKNWYRQKLEFHHKEWQLAHESGKIKAANYHMREYLNYKELYDRTKDCDGKEVESDSLSRLAM